MLEVLYVEDDFRSRQVMEMIAESDPELMSITIFEDSTDFESRLEQLERQPDVILLDIHIKPYNGFEMLNIIRVHPQYCELPVVALTASVMNEEIQLLREAGFDGVFSKPIDLDNFSSLLFRVMRGEKLWNVL